MIINPKQTEYYNKKGVISILNEIKNSLLDFYLHHKTIFKLTGKQQPRRLDKVVSKNSKHSRSVGEIEDCYNELSKYSRSQPEESIAEKVKLMPRKRKRKKNRNWYQNLNLILTLAQLLMTCGWKPKILSFSMSASCVQR